MPKHNPGWKKEQYRHSLASKGVRTKQKHTGLSINKLVADAKNHCILYSKEDLRYGDDRTVGQLIEWIIQQTNSGRVIYRGTIPTDWGHPVYCAVPKATPEIFVRKGMVEFKNEMGLEHYEIEEIQRIK